MKLLRGARVVVGKIPQVTPFSSPEPLGLICDQFPNHVTKKRRALGTRMRSPTQNTAAKRNAHEHKI